MSWQKVVFFLLILACLTPFVSPPIALALGLILALTIGNPFSEQTTKATRILLRGSVILLGFGMNLTTVVKAGKDGILFTIATIFGTLILGIYRRQTAQNQRKNFRSDFGGNGDLRRQRDCGGRAGDSRRCGRNFRFARHGFYFKFRRAVYFSDHRTRARFDRNINSASGRRLRFTILLRSSARRQSSATKPCRLRRPLNWRELCGLRPSRFYLRLFTDRKAEKQSENRSFRGLFFCFCWQRILRTYTPSEIPPSIFDSVVMLAKTGLTVTLFLIGAGLSRETLKKVGVKPLVQGVLLWILISIVSLWAVLHLL